MSEVRVVVEELAKVFRIVVVNFWEIVCKLAFQDTSVLRIVRSNAANPLLPNPATRFMAQLPRRPSIIFWFVLELLRLPGI